MAYANLDIEHYQSSADATSHTIDGSNIPSGIVSGDELLIIGGVDGSPTLTFPDVGSDSWEIPPGASSEIDLPAHTSKSFIRRLKATASISSFDIDCSVSEGLSVAVIRISGQHGTEALKVTEASANTSGQPDTPSNTVAYGIEEIQWISGTHIARGARTVTTDALPNNQTDSGGGTNDLPRIAISTENKDDVSTLDPTGPTLSSTTSWAAYNIAVRSANGVANSDPVLTNPGNQADDIGDTLNLQIVATDVDTGNTLTFSQTGLPAGASLDTATGLITGSPTTEEVASVTIDVDDGVGGTDSISFSWTISPVNAIPVLTSPGNQSDKAGDSVNLSVVATDADTGDTLTFSQSGLPPGLTLDTATGVITGVLTVQGTSTVQITVDDGEGGSDSVVFQWSVTPNNQYTGSIVVFDQFWIDLHYKKHHIANDEYKLVLLDDSITPDKAEAAPQYSTYSSAEVAGGSTYTVGGITLVNLDISTDEFGTKVTADGILVAQDASGFNNAERAVIINNTHVDKPAVCILDFGQLVSVVTDDLPITLGATGLYRIA